MREHARRSRDRTEDLRERGDTVRHGDIADALAGQREGLAVRVADERIRIVFRHVGDGVPRKGNLPIRLIRDDEDRVAIRLLLFAQDLRKPLDGLLGVDRTARIVRGIDDDGLRMRRKRALEGIEIDLEILRAGRHDDELAANGLHEAAILGEERRKGNELVSLLAERLEADRDGGGRTGRHEDVLPLVVHAEPAVQALRHRCPHLGMTGCHRIAVDVVRSLRFQDVHGRLPDEVRRRHVRISQAEVEHLILPDLSCPLPAELKDRPDRRLLRSQLKHFLCNHICTRPHSLTGMRSTHPVYDVTTALILS